ncbi:MAG: host attachment protein [Deltaproteobacteria bacterium]|nr:host attachment protein [Deltaproteobacteria bacterium]
MRKTWVLVADAGRARVYHADPLLNVFELVTAFDHPASRRHASQLVTDHRGRAHASPTGPASAMDGHSDPREEAHVAFAREVAAYLARAATASSRW